ncbi:MAG: tetratricopeptide repeat protein [Bacteroidota bacterium]
MNKAQWLVVSLAVAVFLALYLGFDTKPGKHQEIENKRSLAQTSTDISVLLMEAKVGMSAQASATVLGLEAELDKAPSDSLKAELYKQLSSAWYGFEKPAIAGFYAEKAAELLKNEEAWSIAGTTYSICLQKEEEEKIRSFCTQHAVQALENAASLNPSNPQHKVNLALVYTENPPQDNPMKGVLMLRELNEQYPKNHAILTQLGRLAIKTGQFDRAVQRLEEALSVEPEDPNAICLLAKAYESVGNAAKAAELNAKCEKLMN